MPWTALPPPPTVTHTLPRPPALPWALPRPCRPRHRLRQRHTLLHIHPSRRGLCLLLALAALASPIFASSTPASRATNGAERRSRGRR
jgi:hypothetical protein